jgi:hypothetical protein
VQVQNRVAALLQRDSVENLCDHVDLHNVIEGRGKQTRVTKVSTYPAEVPKVCRLSLVDVLLPNRSSWCPAT